MVFPKLSFLAFTVRWSLDGNGDRQLSPTPLPSQQKLAMRPPVELAYLYEPDRNQNCYRVALREGAL